MAESNPPFESWNDGKLQPASRKPKKGVVVDVSKVPNNAPFGAWHGDRLNSKKDPEVVEGGEGTETTVVEPTWMRAIKPILYFVGTMPEYQDFLYTNREHQGLQIALWTLRCIDAGLRGVGQVMFLNNPITGLFILIAIAIQSWEMAVTGVIGMISSTVVALAMGLNPNAIRNGLFSYNGALIGVAFAALFNVESVTTIATVIITSIFSTILQLALGNALIPKYGVPPFTVPFNVCMYAIYVGSYGYSRINFINRTLNPTLPVSITASDFELDWLELVFALFRGVGQIYLCDKYYVGMLIWLAAVVCSPIAGLMCLLGSSIGIASAIILGCNGPEIYNGLWSYNPVLGAIAVGGMFYLLNWRTALLAVYCAVVCTFVEGFVKTLLLPWDVPALSLPFCLGTWIFVFTQGSIGGVEPIELTEITTAEGNWKNWWIKRHQTETTLPSVSAPAPDSSDPEINLSIPSSSSSSSSARDLDPHDPADESVEISLDHNPIQSSRDFKAQETEMESF